MPKRDQFIDKILNRIRRIDRGSLETYLKDIAAQNSVYEQILQEANEGILVFSHWKY